MGFTLFYNAQTGTYTLTWDSDFNKTKDMGVNHTYRYISVPAKTSPDGILGYATGNSGVSSKTLSAQVGDMFFCASYGDAIKVTGGTIIAQKSATNEYPWVIAKATSTSITFTLNNGASTRFQIGQFR